MTIKQNITDTLEIKCDDNEQYSRRSCLRVQGLDFSSDEDEGVMKKVEKCCSDMGIEFNQNEIDRVHYIGKPYMDTTKNKKVRSLKIMEIKNNLLQISSKKPLRSTKETRFQFQCFT